MPKDSFLVAYNKNNKLTYHDLTIVDNNPLCVPIYEDLIFCAMFLNGERVLYPFSDELKLFFESFTQEERYIIASEFFDSSLINQDSFRNQNTKFCPQFIVPVQVPPVSSDPFNVDLSSISSGGVGITNVYYIIHNYTIDAAFKIWYKLEGENEYRQSLTGNTFPEELAFESLTNELELPIVSLKFQRLDNLVYTEEKII